MNEQTKRSIAEIKRQAETASRNILRDAEKMANDMEMRANALSGLEKEGWALLTNPKNHFFATEIVEDGMRDYGTYLCGTRIQLPSGRSLEIGTGPESYDPETQQATGPRLEPGRRYRMMVVFQDLGNS